MKLVFYNDFRLGVLKGDRVVDAGPAVEEIAWHNPREFAQILITRWGELGARIEEASGAQDGVPVSEVQLCPSVPRPGQLVCLAGNYLEPAHPEPEPFNAFLKATTSVVGQGATVELPAAEANWFHFEPELALVIGRTASHLSASEAMDHIFGYTQFIDASARGLHGGFFLGKSWHTFGPMGPALITADEIDDPNKLPVKLWVNGELRHDFSTGDMARHVPQVLEEVTKVLTLEPGDVVSTGTHHFGLAPIQDGDELRLEIEGLGPALMVQVHDSLKRSW